MCDPRLAFQPQLTSTPVARLHLTDGRPHGHPRRSHRPSLRNHVSCSQAVASAGYGRPQSHGRRARSQPRKRAGLPRSTVRGLAAAPEPPGRAWGQLSRCVLASCCVPDGAVSGGRSGITRLRSRGDDGAVTSPDGRCRRGRRPFEPELSAAVEAGGSDHARHSGLGIGGDTAILFGLKLYNSFPFLHRFITLMGGRHHLISQAGWNRCNLSIHRGAAIRARVTCHGRPASC